MRPLSICLVASEVAPFAKTGGLADVVGALARHLGRAGHRVLCFAPMYRRVREGPWRLRSVDPIQDVPLQAGDQTHFFSLSKARLPGSRVDVHFVRIPALFDRGELYGFGDEEGLRFVLLARAAIESCQWMRFAPDVVHGHDWHAAALPLELRTRYAWDRLFERTRTVLTIHNIAFQGVLGAGMVERLGWEDWRHLLPQEDLAQGRVNLLRTGIRHADRLTTVSETYAREIRSSELGMGLQADLQARARDLTGILNGVDATAWNPRTDKLLPVRYGPHSLDGKALVRDELLARFDLDPRPSGPVLGVVSRLTVQKGFEVLSEALPTVLAREDVRLVALGSGEERYERWFAWLRETFPRKVGFHAGFSEELAHWIEAGSDVFLMPSRFEPCGLNQMYSLRYGTPPLVHRTGGLADTVEPWDSARDAGTGFVFDEFTARAFAGALATCLAAWRDRPAWRRLMLRGMATDFSWERQIDRYVELYRDLVEPPPLRAPPAG